MSLAPAGADAAPRPVRLASWQRALERAAALGVLTHAAFLSISIAGMQIGLAVALGALLLLRASGRRVWARGPLDLPCLLLAGAAVGSLGLGALGGSMPVGWHEATLWRSILSPLVVLSAIEASRGPPGREDAAAPRRLALAALATWAAAALLPSAVAWLQYWTGLDPLHALGLRAQPVRGVVPAYPDSFAAVGFVRWYQRLAHNLTPPLCVAGAVAAYGGVRGRLRVLLAVATVAGATAVVLTLSRAAWVTLLVAALVVALSVGRSRRWALAAVAAGAAAMALHPGVRARVRHLTVPGDNDDRKNIWRVCRAVIDDHPLTGVGWGNLPRRSLPYYDRLAPWHPLRAWCHNSFLSAWAEGGPLLCGALLAFWALLLRACWRWQRAGADALGRAAAAGGLAALVAMLMNSLAHDILYASEAMYGLGFALGVTAALARLPGASGTTEPVSAPAGAWPPG